MTIKNWDTYTRNLWGWDWLSGCFPQNPRIHPSDRDGFVSVDGYLLFIDGKVTAGLPPPARADEIMVRTAGNVTCLYLRADPNGWQPELDGHEPQTISHYYLIRGPWPARSWQWDRWVPTTKDDMWHLVCQWATWADERAHRDDDI
ncbi:MAG: hypothetical protein J2P16_08750 [Mycobacterium sp.]|nr:hypothetical protein [Mycobacterium sp.]